MRRRPYEDPLMGSSFLDSEWGEGSVFSRVTNDFDIPRRVTFDEEAAARQEPSFLATPPPPPRPAAYQGDQSSTPYTVPQVQSPPFEMEEANQGRGKSRSVLLEALNRQDTRIRGLELENEDLRRLLYERKTASTLPSRSSRTVPSRQDCSSSKVRELPQRSSLKSAFRGSPAVDTVESRTGRIRRDSKFDLFKQTCDDEDWKPRSIFTTLDPTPEKTASISGNDLLGENTRAQTRRPFSSMQTGEWEDTQRRSTPRKPTPDSRSSRFKNDELEENRRAGIDRWSRSILSPHSPGKHFVADLCDRLELDVGHHTLLAEIMDRYYARREQGRSSTSSPGKQSASEHLLWLRRSAGDRHARTSPSRTASL